MVCVLADAKRVDVHLAGIRVPGVAAEVTLAVRHEEDVGGAGCGDGAAGEDGQGHVN